MQPTDIIEEWFGPGDDRTVIDARSSRWFTKDPSFDTHLRDRYGALVAKAIKGPLPGWADTPAGALAEVLLLDQFTRNIYRGTPRMYAGDARALPAARAALTRHATALRSIEQLFLWLPFEHAEDRAVQAECVAGITALAEQAPADVADVFKMYITYAIKHQQVVDQFGRFPHRNAILGRPDAPAERAYLAQPGAGF